MTTKLVIFDCDGVLVDTEPTTNVVIAEDLAERGLTIAPNKIGALFMGGTMQGVGRTAKDMGADIPDDWLDIIYSKMFAALEQGVRVFDKVEAFLDTLEGAGIAIAIASNGPMHKMEVTLTPSGLRDRFAGRIYSGHDYTPKPSPQMIQHAMQLARATADETIFIDDSANGAKAGIAAGVQTFGFDPTGSFSHLRGLPVTQVASIRQIASTIGVSLP